MSAEFQGAVDFCDQHTVKGWTNAPSLEVYINGEVCGEATMDAICDDLVAAGIAGAHRFVFRFPSPLWLTERVTLRLPNNALMAPGENANHLERLLLLVSGLDLTRPGLEFGPLNRPAMPRKHVDVHYVDHEGQEGLNGKLVHMEAADRAGVPAIDYVLTKGRSLSDMVQNEKFAWIVASHVAEHIPDVIGWIQQVEEVLEDQGCVALALPHGERTFDACRPVSTFEDLVAAYIMKLNCPSPHQVLRHFLGVAEWAGSSLTKPENEAELHNAIRMARHANAGDYVDVHCNVFTPKSFAKSYALIRRCGLVRLRLDSVIETNGTEFFVHLTKQS